MPTVTTALPPELWLIILNLVIESQISLVDWCNYLTFPDIDSYLRAPESSSPIDQCYKLRLVCQTFNALLHSSPHFFMKSGHLSIPTAARALYIRQHNTRSSCLERLVAEPSRCHRVVLLDLVCDIVGNEFRPPLFDLLCQNAHLLHHLRTLTLRLLHSVMRGPHIHFLMRLNDAFPMLGCLILCLQMSGPALVQSLTPDAAFVTFENLEIVDLGLGISHLGLHAPRLRHIALGSCSRFDMEKLMLSPVESVLIRAAEVGTQINVRHFSNLRLLGIPKSEEHLIIISPLNKRHSLDHIWFYMEEVMEIQHSVTSILQVPERLPGISRITLDLSVLDIPARNNIREILQDAEISSSLLKMKPSLPHCPRIVLERTQVGSRKKIEPEILVRGGFMAGIWKRFRR